MIILDDIMFDRVYIRDGKLYRVLAYCPEPSITMVPIGERVFSEDQMSFGVSGLTNKEFELVPNLIIGNELNLEVVKDV
ncbi:MAG: hypothetical protein ACTSPB_05635 [Candidatus Thorarchaeota archaeon]